MTGARRARAALVLGLAMGLAMGTARAAQPVTADDLQGLLFQPPDARGAVPGMIVLGGSEGGLAAPVSEEAAALAAQGYVVLQLAYFGLPGLPQSLQLIPVEYFERAVAWLQKQPHVDARRIGIMGTSVGGEAALLVASHDPSITAVIAAVPSGIVWQGIGPWGMRNPASSFSLHGRPLPDLPYRVAESGTVFDRYAGGLGAISQHRRALIPIQAIDGPVMLVCGGRDVVWPSCPLAREAARRLRAAGFPHAVVLRAFPKAGHAVFGPPEPAGSEAYRDLGALGGTAAENERAREKVWPEALAFLAAAFAAPKNGF